MSSWWASSGEQLEVEITTVADDGGLIASNLVVLISVFEALVATKCITGDSIVRDETKRTVILRNGNQWSKQTKTTPTAAKRQKLMMISWLVMVLVLVFC